jgi:hypothetical protein
MEKLGLIIQSHGNGAAGLGTNTGGLSLDATTTAIQTRLLGSTHQKLDLLDFDACDMAETGVLQSVQSVANDVVASQAVEYAMPTHDGQNLNAAMWDLMQNPGMSGKDFGNTIVNEAATGDNGQGLNNATPTLANIDLTKYGDFEQKLNQFGAALNKIDGDPQNMALLHSQIEVTTKPNTGVSPELASGRDLRSFAQGVLSDSQAQMFNGNTTDLEAAAKDLLASMDGMVTARFGENEKLLGQAGGLDTPLPGSEILNNEIVDREINPVNRLAADIDGIAGSRATNIRMSSQETLVQTAGYDLNRISNMEHGKQNLELGQLEGDLVDVGVASNEGDLRNAVIRLQADTHAAQKGELGADMGDAMKAAAKMEEATYVAMTQEQLGPDWNEFIQRVKAGAK